MDVETVEAYARAALVEARMDGDERPAPLRLCSRLGITIARAPRSSFVGRNVAQIGRLEGRDLIRVRAGLPPWLESFHVMHETLHILMQRWSVVRPDEEELANAFAGAVLVPRDPLLHVWRRGEDLRDVIEHWSHVGPTCCALRIGETRSADAAVTQGRRVIYVRSEQPLTSTAIDLAADAATRNEPLRAQVAKAYPLADGTRRAALILVG